MSKTYPFTEEDLASWMKSALASAIEGVAKGQSPFGAVVVGPDGTQLAAEHNQVLSTLNPTLHAEVVAIAAACSAMKTTKLNGSWLFTTGEPCPICIATAATVEISQVVFGASAETIERAGYETLGVKAVDLASLFNTKPLVRGSVLAIECEALLLNHKNRA